LSDIVRKASADFKKHFREAARFQVYGLLFSRFPVSSMIFAEFGNGGHIG
jgi:hypothetical protein